MEEGVTGIPEEKKKRRFTLIKGRGKRNENAPQYIDEEWATILRRFLIRAVK